MKSNLTLSDWNRYDKQKRTTMMRRREDGLMQQNNEHPSGITNTYTIDGIKCYTAVGLERNDPYIITDYLDWRRDFDFQIDHEIPEGEYIRHGGVYGGEKTLIVYDRGIHTYKFIRYLLSMKYITFNEIKNRNLSKTY